MEKIEIKPTWAGLMPAFIMGIESGTAEGKRMAREELMALARGADAMNEQKRMMAEELRKASTVLWAAKDFIWETKKGIYTEKEKAHLDYLDRAQTKIDSLLAKMAGV